MVVHFKEIAAHKSAVLGLYKRILTGLKGSQLEDAIKKDLSDKIRFEFKLGKSFLSPAKAQDAMLNAHKFSVNIQKYEITKDMNLLEPLRSSKKLEKRKSDRNANKRQQQKPKGRELPDDLIEIQNRSYISIFTHSRQRYNKLPKNIDPVMKQEILKPLALFRRAKLDMKIAERKLARGPYVVRQVTAYRIPFLRRPWRQTTKFSNMVKSYLQLEQSYVDIRKLIESQSSFYKDEANWEDLIGGKDGKEWRDAMPNLLESLKKTVMDRRTYYRQYGEIVLPLLAPDYQKASNEIHKQMKGRFMELIPKVEDSTPFDPMIKKEFLPSLVKRYRFETRRRKKN